MYVQGGQEGVENWVAAVKRLRYKDFQLAAHPASMDPKDVEKELPEDAAGLFETDSVKYFASEMERRARASPGGLLSGLSSVPVSPLLGESTICHLDSSGIRRFGSMNNAQVSWMLPHEEEAKAQSQKSKQNQKAKSMMMIALNGFDPLTFG
ncbi:unnamed protein product [Zymoseptoria tritici ST99CH_1A5]|uniref:Uncharacterized protein n=2 Tax=Zymoseptoria tritici TaxID=1047171 RepID=A0A2H1GU47_ZYMTR|nr:unnamed protein product [Zymoseptoria tritici ST99CH_1E4]SMY27114.1 unnamed protein product [Zymoseptoria tritici ST99CH_1A5]